MRILMTGATGFLGHAIAKEALVRGHELTVLARDAAATRAKFPFPARVFEWDAFGGPPPAASFADVEAVIHLAGEPIASERWTDARKRKILDSRVLGTRHLRAAVARAPAVRTWVSASAIGYYGENPAAGDAPGWDEGAAAGEGFLAEVCRGWEAELFAEGTEQVRKVALRIGIVLGRGGGALEKLLPLFRAGVGGRLGDGHQWMSWIHEADLVRAFLHALETPAARGPINAVAPRPVTNAELTRALARALGRPAVLPAPRLALRLALGEMSQVVLASQKVSGAKLRGLGFDFQFSDVQAALDEIAAPDGERGADVFEADQFVPAPPGRVFEFFSDARNLESITPPTLGFQIEKMSSALAEGALIDYRLRIRGVPARWKTRIERWDPPRAFVDNQLEGPYRLWRHTHEFRAVRGGTLMSDRVVYRLPLGKLGRAAAGWLVRRDVEGIFAFRRRTIAGLFKPTALA